jgi:DNA replication and repair protein RecF
MASEGRDHSLGTTTVGPHRADLILEVEGRRIQQEASRGQQKLAAAALVLAQAAVLSRSRGGGVLLIDDPAAELDAASLEGLLDAVSTIRIQVIFTALTMLQLAPSAGSSVFHVERGDVRRL